MNTLKTTTYTPPADEQSEHKQEPAYKSGDIYKKHFHHNDTERNKQANRQTMSHISEMLSEDKPTPSKAISKPYCAPHAKDAGIQPPQDNDNEDHFNTPPRVPDNAFPPDLQSAVDIACHGTEAHPMAVALHYACSHWSAALHQNW